MSIIDLEKLLLPISDDEPCGEDLSDLTEYYVLEEYSKGKEETQFSEAEPPEWNKVQKTALELLEKGKEMWVVVHLISSMTSLHGVQGLHEGIQLLSGMLESFWDDIYPERDDDDDNPFEQRMNILSSIATDQSAVMENIKNMALCKSRQLGSFSYKDLLMSRGEIKPKEGDEVPQAALIEGAIKETEPEFLSDIIDKLRETCEEISRIEDFLSEHAGQENNISNITKLNGTIEAILKFLEQTAGKPAVLQQDETGETEETSDGDQDGSSESSSVTAQSAEGSLNTRDDVYSVMSEMISWYEVNEPASPVSQILIRARALVGKSFMQIIASTAGPDIPQITELFGTEDPANGQTGAPVILNAKFGIEARNDIMIWLDKVSNWYYAFEPSSPVPLFIDKAKRLVGKNFQEIINEIANQAQQQVADLIKVR